MLGRVGVGVRLLCIGRRWAVLRGQVGGRAVFRRNGRFVEWTVTHRCSRRPVLRSGATEHQVTDTSVYSTVARSGGPRQGTARRLHGFDTPPLDGDVRYVAAMSRAQPLSPAERRSQLLAAARRVFAARGYHNAGVSHIIREAGVARGTFYNYFESKRTVFTAVLDELTTELTGPWFRSTSPARLQRRPAPT